MVNLVALVIGAIPAIVFVGYFALKVGAPPLIIITFCCLALMVYAFYQESQEAGGGPRTNHQPSPGLTDP